VGDIHSVENEEEFLHPETPNYWSKKLCVVWIGWALSNVEAYEGVSDSFWQHMLLLKDLWQMYWLVSDERTEHCLTLSFWLFWLVTQFLFQLLSGRHSFSGKWWRGGLEPNDSNYWSRNLCGIWLGWLLSNVKAYEGISDSYCQHVLPLKDALWVGPCTMSSLELAIWVRRYTGCYLGVSSLLSCVWMLITFN
jgi:hypothetical protein